MENDNDTVENINTAIMENDHGTATLKNDNATVENNNNANMKNNNDTIMENDIATAKDDDNATAAEPTAPVSDADASVDDIDYVSNASVDDDDYSTVEDERIVENADTVDNTDDEYVEDYEYTGDDGGDDSVKVKDWRSHYGRSIGDHKADLLELEAFETEHTDYILQHAATDTAICRRPYCSSIRCRNGR